MGLFIRLVESETSQKKEQDFFKTENRYVISGESFNDIPGMPIAYWISEKMRGLFTKYESIGKYAISDGQTKTGDNNKYLRLLWEVDNEKIGRDKKWVIHAKGGSFRRWYGNVDTVIDWSLDARTHYREDHVARIAPEYIWYRQGICWTLISGDSKYGFRLLEKDTTFNLAAPSVFFDDEVQMYYVLGYLNTKIAEEIIHLVNPTLNTNISDITIQPYYEADDAIKMQVEGSVKECIDICKDEWDSYETSYGFKKHPLV